MNRPKTPAYPAILAVVAATLMSGCAKKEPPPPPSPEQPTLANRGEFTGGACAVDQRMPVPDDAAFAVYFDSDGNEIQSAPAEFLEGTQNNMMCPSAEAKPPEQGGGPGVCSPLCKKQVGAKLYCVPCTNATNESGGE